MIFWKITAVRKQVVNIKAHGLFLHMTAITVYSAESEDLPADHLLGGLRISRSRIPPSFTRQIP